MNAAHGSSQQRANDISQCNDTHGPLLGIHHKHTMQASRHHCTDHFLQSGGFLTNSRGHRFQIPKRAQLSHHFAHRLCKHREILLCQTFEICGTQTPHNLLWSLRTHDSDTCVHNESVRLNDTPQHLYRKVCVCWDRGEQKSSRVCYAR
eukprot:EC716811.1.p1 GENE.EC716811.1~~EC716811.1.p1  ORF type:complete len:149 (-),score=10.36 EC716811.1:137-583(-)